MKVKVTDQGVVIPREWFEGVDEVEIQKEDHQIVVVPIAADDPILALGSDPVTVQVSDGAANHDAYLYGPDA